MKKTFVKMHGLGNDFAIFDAREQDVTFNAEEIRHLGNRRTGIGFDQMAVIYPAKTKGTDIFFEIYNADGGEVGACGNVTRCIASLYLQDTGKNICITENIGGVLEAKAMSQGIQVDMGKVKTGWQDIPLSHEEKTLSLNLSIGNLSNPVAVNVGNPHAVFFVDDAESVDLAAIGPEIETHELFPERTNVEVVEILSRDKIRMLVWERGVGITPACGTGACAAVVAAVRRNLTDSKVTVVLDGGELYIDYNPETRHVTMTGPVSFVYRGEIA